MSHDTDLTSDDPAVPRAPRRPFDLVTHVMAAVGTAWIFVLMFLVVADVVGRSWFSRPITGVAEFSANSVAAIVFLHLAGAITAGKMTRSDFVVRLLAARSPTVVRVLETIYALVGALLFALLAVISWPEWRSAWTGHEYFGVQGVYMIPTWPFRGLIVLGSAMAALAYLMTIPLLWRQPLAPQGAPDV